MESEKIEHIDNFERVTELIKRAIPPSPENISAIFYFAVVQMTQFIEKDEQIVDLCRSALENYRKEGVIGETPKVD